MDINQVIHNLEISSLDYTDLYNKIIIFTKENYKQLTQKELDIIDDYLKTHANSLSTRTSIFKFVPRKESNIIEKITNYI